MPNYCDYRMTIIGYPANVGKFLEVIRNPYNYGNIYFFKNPTPHLYRVFETYIDDYQDYNQFMVKMDLSGYCAWSVHSCMMEGLGSYHGDYHGCGWDKNKPKSTMDYITAGTSLIQLCRNLNLYLECYSDEPGMAFQEHYVIDNFGRVVVEEEADNVLTCFIDDYETEEEFKDDNPDIDVSLYREAKKLGFGYIRQGGFGDPIYGDADFQIINDQNRMMRVVSGTVFYGRYGDEVRNMVRIVDTKPEKDILTRSKELNESKTTRHNEMWERIKEQRKERGYYE